jgi:hypothetical protein
MKSRRTVISTGARNLLLLIGFGIAHFVKDGKQQRSITVYMDNNFSEVCFMGYSAVSYTCDSKT